MRLGPYLFGRYTYRCALGSQRIGAHRGFKTEDEWFEYRLRNDPRFLKRIEAARQSLAKGKGTRLEEISD